MVKHDTVAISSYQASSTIAMFNDFQVSLFWYLLLSLGVLDKSEC